MNLEYDSDSDVLYLAFDDAECQRAYVENERGDILIIDKSNDRVVGCTIPFALYRLKRDGSILIPEIGSIPLNDKFRELVGQ
jgi:uncharacterized protein YuzE